MNTGAGRAVYGEQEDCKEEATSQIVNTIRDILLEGLSIVRDERHIQEALARIHELQAVTMRDENRIRLAEAMLESALTRKESRGAHYRVDYPRTDDAYRKTTVAVYDGQRIKIQMQEL